MMLSRRTLVSLGSFYYACWHVAMWPGSRTWVRVSGGDRTWGSRREMVSRQGWNSSCHDLWMGSLLQEWVCYKRSFSSCALSVIHVTLQQKNIILGAVSPSCVHILVSPHVPHMHATDLGCNRVIWFGQWAVTKVMQVDWKKWLYTDTVLAVLRTLRLSCEQALDSLSATTRHMDDAPVF
jgi:hypothetical protein